MVMFSTPNLYSRYRTTLKSPPTTAIPTSRSSPITPPRASPNTIIIQPIHPCEHSFKTIRHVFEFAGNEVPTASSTFTVVLLSHNKGQEMAEKISIKNQHILKDLIETKEIVSIYIYFKRLNKNIKLISLYLTTKYRSHVACTSLDRNKWYQTQPSNS